MITQDILDAAEIYAEKGAPKLNYNHNVLRQGYIDGVHTERQRCITILHDMGESGDGWPEHQITPSVAIAMIEKGEQK